MKPGTANVLGWSRRRAPHGRGGRHVGKEMTMSTTVLARLHDDTSHADRARDLFARVGKNGTMAEMVGWSFVDFDGETLRLGFEPQPIFCNPLGTIHGGFVASMLDETMGSTIFALSEGRTMAATISATIDYVRPAMLGALECVGRVRYQGKSIVFVEAELMDARGRLLAKSSGSFKIMTLP
jgi:uncharacterized protein (TIGR00369 family)